MFRKSLFICFLLVYACACAPSRFVKPLQEGQLAIGADLGGPLIGFADMTIPIPLTNLNVGYGLTDKTTAFAGIHTTALAYGLAQLDAGLVHAFYQPKKFMPGISSSATANLMVGLKEAELRMFPQVDVNAFWEYGPGNNKLVYVGLSNWFEFAQTRAHQEEQPAHWLPSLHIGHVFVRKKWDYTFEFKQLAFNQDKRKVIVDYKGPGNKGASGLYFSVRRKF